MHSKTKKLAQTYILVSSSAYCPTSKPFASHDAISNQLTFWKRLPFDFSTPLGNHSPFMKHFVTHCIFHFAFLKRFKEIFTSFSRSIFTCHFYADSISNAFRFLANLILIVVFVVLLGLVRVIVIWCDSFSNVFEKITLIRNFKVVRKIAAFGDCFGYLEVCSIGFKSLRNGPTPLWAACFFCSRR